MEQFPQKIIYPQIVQILHPQKIVAGSFHSYVISNNGIFVWGNNSNFNLGIQLSQTYIYTPQFIPIKNVKEISTGTKHSFAYNDSQVYGWGSNINFQLGLPEQKYYPITKVKFFEQAHQQNFNLIKMSCGQSHSLAIIKINNQNGVQMDRLFAWGNSKSHQLTIDSNLIIPYPVLCQFQYEVKDIYSKNDYNITITDKDDIYSWGSGVFGRLGVGGAKIQRIPKKIDLQKIRNIGIGQHHVVAINISGQGYAWGHGLHGQLGIGKLSNENTPKKILLNLYLKGAACGQQHTLLLTEQGQLYSCGSNYSGCLGHQQELDQKKRCLIPKRVSIENVQKISVGNKHNIILTKSKKIYCWGDNSFGQLGIKNKFNEKKSQIQIKKQENHKSAQHKEKTKMEQIEQWHKKYKEFLQIKQRQQKQLLQQLQILLKK